MNENTCKSCKTEEPKYFFRCYIGPESFEAFYCEECFKKLGGLKPLGLVGDELIFEEAGVGRFTDEQLKIVAELKCEVCGTTHSDVEKQGWFGCEECYTVFGDLLNIADAQIEASLQQKASLAGTANDTIPDGKIEILKRLMDKAIAAEQYERAAKLRDEINALSQKKI